MRELLTRLKTILQRRIGDPDTTPPEEYRQRQMVLVYLLGGIAACIFATVNEATHFRHNHGLFYAINALGLSLLFFFFHRIRRMTIAAQALLTVSLAIILYTYIAIETPFVLPLLALLPLVATFLLSLRSGLVWMVISASIILIMEVWHPQLLADLLPAPLSNFDKHAVASIIVMQILIFSVGVLQQLTARHAETLRKRQEQRQREEEARRRAAESLLDSHEALFETIIENLPLPIWYKDTEYRYVGCNSAFAIFLGKNRKDIEGLLVTDVAPNSLAARYRESDLQVLQEQAAHAYDTQVLHADGTLHEVVMFKAPYFHPDGSIAGVAGAMIDQTDRNRQEKHLNAVMEVRNKLFAVIGHDLRSPLTKLQQFLGIYVENREMFSPQEWEELFRDLRFSADSMRDLLDNLLIWTRSQQGILKPSFTKFFVQLMLDEIQAISAPHARSKAIELYFENNLAAPLVSDKIILSTILRNLVSNAIKFTPKGGSVFVRAWEDNETALNFMVKDSGIGLPQEILARLFNEDKEKVRYGTESERGTGLGLVLCLELAELLGGTVLARNNDGGSGSTFTLHLPAAELGSV